MNIWNKHNIFKRTYAKIILWWHRFFLRTDEFHKSLDMSGFILGQMCSCERKRYCNDLAKRRDKAHNKTIK